MLTIFSTPKAFRGHFDVIQRNAIQSWCSLHPACQVILFGDDDGTDEVASEFGVRHVAHVECNEFGTPLVSSMFETAQQLATSNIMCFANADIIFLDDFLPALMRIRWRRYLMIGLKTRLELNGPIDFTPPGWINHMRALLNDRGVPDPYYGLDYFVFPRGLYTGLPPLAVGRPGWDNWMVYRARSEGIPVVDATGAVTAIHQEHGYEHHPDGYDGVYEGPESERNIEYAGGLEYCFNWEDATWLIGPSGLRPALSLPHLQRRRQTLRVLYPEGGFRSALISVSVDAVFVLHSSFVWTRRCSRRLWQALRRRGRLFLGWVRR